MCSWQLSTRLKKKIGHYVEGDNEDEIFRVEAEYEQMTHIQMTEYEKNSKLSIISFNI